MRCNTDLETWLHDFEDDIFRILVYRKPGQYTPYEMENKFSDESLYVSNEYKKVFIEDVIELPDKDVLIGFREVLDVNQNEDGEYECELADSIEYYKLSEIKLECFKCDQVTGGEF